MNIALLKLSTANAFARGQLGSLGKSSDAPGASHALDSDMQGPGGSLFLADDPLAALEPHCPASPQSRGPYYGFYADYEDVMGLLHTAVIADGSFRNQLAHVTSDRLVHVAHLGLGACCSVDLVAVHCEDGSRLLAAAKSCYLPPSDPRMRASIREAELLRRCADCPFIMQLLAIITETPSLGPDPAAVAGSPVNAAGCGGLGFEGSGAGGGSGSQVGLRRSGSCHVSPRGSTELMYGMQQQQPYQHMELPYEELNGSYQQQQPWGYNWGGGGRGAAATPLAADAVASRMTNAAAFQAWAEWRGGGGGGEEELEWQLRQRLAAAYMSNGGADAGGFSLDITPGEPAGWGRASMRRLDSMAYGEHGVGLQSATASTGGWGWDSTAGLQGSPAASQLEAAVGGAGAGGGVAYSGGMGYGAEGGGGWGQQQQLQQRLGGRRASMDIIDMYRGCAGMMPHQAVADGISGAGEAAGQGGGGEPAVMCTLLVGWARCGDLRRLVQLLLSRSAAHQHNKHTGAAPAVSGMPLLMPEDAARFYLGCVVLALEHLHGRLNTVHRDLKLANLLLLANGYAIVGDLGTAVDLSTVPGGRLNSKVGSPGHMAPECRDRDEAGYDTAADMWSLGACLFSLLTGHLPAGTAGPPNRAWVAPVSRHWSRELQDLVVKLLSWSPSQRPSVAKLMKDPWFRGFKWKALKEQRMQPPNTPWKELLWWPRESRQLL